MTKSNLQGDHRKITTTSNYVVVPRERATALHQYVVTLRERVGNLQRRVGWLESQLGAAENLTILALHELAKEQGRTDPQRFIGKWLNDHRKKEW